MLLTKAAQRLQDQPMTDKPRHHPDFSYTSSGTMMPEGPEITDEARQLITEAMAACTHHDRAVARGRAAGAVVRAFPEITRSIALSWVGQVPDPFTPGVEPAERYP